MAACDGPSDPGPPDTVAPAVSIQHPLDPPATRAGTIDVRGEAYDSVGAVRVTYQRAGGAEQEAQVTSGPTATWSFTVSLPADSNLVQVHAYDRAGNRGTGQIWLLRDTVGPAVALRQPNAAGNDNATASVDPVHGLRIFVQASDPSGIARMVARLNGGEPVPFRPGCPVAFTACDRDPRLPGQEAWFTTDIRAGLNTVLLESEDRLGNRTQSEYRFQVAPAS